MHFRPPVLKKTAKRWYVEYWYRVPEILYPKYKKQWHRFRIIEELNRSRSDDYAQKLVKSIRALLESGELNPFEREIEHYWQEHQEEAKGADVSLNRGLDDFMAYHNKKGSSDNTTRSYQTVVNYLKEYFTKGNALYSPVSGFTKMQLKSFFDHYGWKGTTYNNYITYARAIFNWFVKEGMIDKSPMVGIEYVTVKTSKNKYFSDKIAEKLKTDIKKVDAELFDFLQLIYYCALRPKEIKLLRVEHILFDRKLMYVPANVAKNGQEGYIPLGEEVLEMLTERTKSMSQHEYIFGGKRKRSANFFTIKFKPFKEKYKLGDDYTMYGFKHTRAIHLAEAGADPYLIMRLFRHSSLEETIKYIRELGVVDFKEIHAKTKKF